jgi:hypothetical protein
MFIGNSIVHVRKFKALSEIKMTLGSYLYANLKFG